MNGRDLQRSGLRRPLIAGLLLLAVQASVCLAQHRERSAGPLLRQIDHILIESSNPGDLFSFFVDTLRLPVAWPMAEYQGFSSGGVSAGNVVIEVLRFAGPGTWATAKRGPARFIGLALEPMNLSSCLSALRARGVAHDPPQPFNSRLPDGTLGTLWTNVGLPTLTEPGISVFLCEYNSAYLHAAIRRNQLGGQLALRKGGPLGLRAVKEVVIATTNPAGRKAALEGLSVLESESDPGIYRIGTGPALRFVSGPAPRIQRLVLKVLELKAARTFLARNRLLGPVQGGTAAIAPSAIQGLTIRVTDD